MSWEHILKTIKCPCGQGTIEKDTRSDDWGRYEESSPYINCPVCKEKYIIRTISHSSPFKWKGGYTCHFLVDKNINLSVKHEKKYPYVNEYDLIDKDFPHYLVVAYKLDWLIEAQKEANDKTSIVSLKGFASIIAKKRKKHLGSARINEVRNDIALAIKDYNSYTVNKEQLEEQDELDRKAQNELEDKIKNNGIPLDI